MVKKNIFLTSVIIFVSILRTDSVLWPCATTEDCSAVANASCSDKFRYCYCPAGHVFSSDVTKCLQESAYGEPCSDSVQCAHMLTGAKCEDGICGCADGYTYVRGRCRQLSRLNGACSEDVDCIFNGDRESVVCRNNICTCAVGFYERSTNVCRRISIAKGDPCLVQSDCQGKTLMCDTAAKQCVTSSDGNNSPSSGISSSKTNLRDIGTQISLSSFKDDNPSEDINYKLLHTASTFDTSDSNNKHSMSSFASSMREESKQFGNPCTNEGEPCSGLEYSICRKALCHCRLGYYLSENICKAELGEEAMSEKYCSGPGHVLRNGICTCNFNWFYNPNLRKCIKPALGIDTNCQIQSQCSPYGAAYCPLVPMKCQCHPYAYYNKTSELCQLKEGLGQFCEDSTDCPFPNTKCTEQNSCECKPGFVEKNNNCKPTIDQECNKDSDCAIDNSECVQITNEKRSVKLISVKDDESDGDKYCKCKKEFVHIKGECLKRATRYEDECKENEQCTPLLGDLGKCINETCMCDKPHHHKDGQCYEKKPLDAFCDRSSECFVKSEPDSVECRNSQCKCKLDHTTDVEAQVCIRPKAPQKNSSNRPSPLKVITMMLFGSAVLLTGSALKEAYYP